VKAFPAPCVCHTNPESSFSKKYSIDDPLNRTQLMLVENELVKFLIPGVKEHVVLQKSEYPASGEEILNQLF
jgi:hypothetical protein